MPPDYTISASSAKYRVADSRSLEVGNSNQFAIAIRYVALWRQLQGNIISPCDWLTSVSARPPNYNWIIHYIVFQYSYIVLTILGHFVVGRGGP